MILTPKHRIYSEMFLKHAEVYKNIQKYYSVKINLEDRQSHHENLTLMTSEDSIMYLEEDSELSY